MITNADATIYLSTECGFDCVYLPKVMWQGSTSASRSTSGEKGSESTRIFIPLELLKSIPKGSYIVRGACEYLYSQEHPIAELTRDYGALTIIAVIRCDYGSANGQHWEVTAV